MNGVAYTQVRLPGTQLCLVQPPCPAIQSRACKHTVSYTPTEMNRMGAKSKWSPAWKTISIKLWKLWFHSFTVTVLTTRTITGHQRRSSTQRWHSCLCIRQGRVVCLCHFGWVKFLLNQFLLNSCFRKSLASTSYGAKTSSSGSWRLQRATMSKL
jgi:hypothetical protein